MEKCSVSRGNGVKKRVRIDLTALCERKSILKMCLSTRGDGKSTWIAKKAVQSFDESGKAAVFCRRFETELSREFFDTFITLIKTAAPDLLNRDYDVIMPSKKRAGALLLQPLDSDVKKNSVTFVPLSKAARLKSALDWSTHKNLFMDEYIPLDGRYLKDEATALLELYQTIDRQHYDNFMLICGNKVTQYNPVFEYFGITSWTNGKINSYRNGALDAFMWDRKLQAEDETAQSVFDALVAGTEYDNYANGAFLDDENALINGQHTRCAVFDVFARNKLFTLYQNEKSVCFGAHKDGKRPVYSIEAAPQSVNARWLKDAENVRLFLQKYKYRNNLFFENAFVFEALKAFYKAI